MNKKLKLKNNRKEKGITLIALVLTIIILIILAGVTLRIVLNQDGIIDKSKNAADDYNKEAIKEAILLDILSAKTENKGNISEDSLKLILEQYGTINYEDDGITIRSITTQAGYEMLLTEIWNGTTQEDDKEENDDDSILPDGSWNGMINTPKIKDTGLTAVYWNGTKWVDLTEKSSKEEWDNWYNYSDTSVSGAGTSNWANARSKDGSMWVWIPRYEYKIDTTNKTIDVRFISTDVKAGTTGYATDETTGIVTSETDNYIIHPAFMKDTNNEYVNGGWDKELPGFWVAKYEAGFQNSTVGEDTKTVQNSPTLKYTAVNSSYKTNFYGTITKDTTPLSYPIFKAETNSYNVISLADAYFISQEIDGKNETGENITTAKDFYGLINVDSHLMKNSEWGAVAYLSHSKYGLNGTAEVQINTKKITSYGNSNTPNDVNASTTKNMTGIFDLSGATWERTAGFYKGGTSSDYYNAIVNSNTTSSTKYLTLYTSDDKKGDASKETKGWKSDYYSFVNGSYPVFDRGGNTSERKLGRIIFIKI